MKIVVVSSLSAVFALALPSMARADSFAVLNFSSGDSRLFSDEQDWSPGAYKAECGGNTPVLGGISAMSIWNPGVWPWYSGYFTGGTEAALCLSNSNIIVNLYDTDTLNIYTQGFSQGQDDRLDTSTGDWAYGYWKAECAQNEVVTGISQWPQGPQFSSVHCSVGANLKSAQNCAPHNFDGQDGEETTSRGDWSQNFWKGDCSPGRYVKGVAMATGQNNQAAVILCCSPGF